VRKYLVVAVLVISCLVLTRLAVVTFSYGGIVYNPWYDINDDGKIDVKDVYKVSQAYGTNGVPLAKASVQYDSGWIDITDKRGQNIMVMHGLGITDWNNESIDVGIMGKTSPDGGLLRYLGLTRNMGWSRTYGGTPTDYAYGLVRTADSGYALAGTTYSFGVGNGDVWLVKTDAVGNELWNKTYGGTNTEEARALVQTVDGGYALAGYTVSFGAGSGDFWLVKTDAVGNELWNKTYGGASDDEACALMQTGDGGYAIAGWTYSFGAGMGDYWLIKTDTLGNALWNKTYGGANDDWAYAMVQTGDGGYAIAGCAASLGVGNGDFWLVKTDTLGNAMWNKTYGGTNTDEAYALVQTIDGGYALAGTTYSFGLGDGDFWLVRTNSSGGELWNRTYGGIYDDEAHALVQTVDGGYAIAGWTYSFGAGMGDFWLVKTDALGNAMWIRTYGGSNSEEAWALVQTADGGYALAGATGSFGAGGNYDAWLVKTDVESGLAWVDSTANTITLHRGATDAFWNFVRVRVWEPRQTP
jgi:hypothetical protein